MKRAMGVAAVLAALALAAIFLFRGTDEAPVVGSREATTAASSAPPMAPIPSASPDPTPLPSMAGGPGKVDLGVADVPPALVRAHVAQLVARFEGGEAAIGYELATQLEACANAQEGVDSLAETLSQGGRVDPDAIARTRALAAECRSVSPGLLARRAEFRDRAAAAGDLRAQVTYGDYPPLELRTADGAFRYPEKVVEFKARALGYLTSAAHAGEAQAMLRLSTAFAEGTFSPPDRVQAFAYYLAAVSAAPDLDPGQSARAGYEAGLTPEDKARANDIRRRLLEGRR